MDAEERILPLSPVTKEFLKWNDLSNEVYPTFLSFRIWRMFLVYILPLIVLLYATNGKTFSDCLPALLCCVAGIVTSYYLRLKREPGAGPHFIFYTNGLQTLTEMLEWKNILSWEDMPPPSRGAAPFIKVIMEKPVNGSLQFHLYVDAMAISNSNFLNLLDHYKSEYGR